MPSINQYQVLITHRDAPPVWQAVVLGLPAVAARGTSRQEVIEQITERLNQTLQHAEIITLTLAASDNGQPGAEDKLAAMGWDDHGLFKDDPEALALFDEIEAERDKYFIEPLQP